MFVTNLRTELHLDAFELFRVSHHVWICALLGIMMGEIAEAAEALHSLSPILVWQPRLKEHCSGAFNDGAIRAFNDPVRFVTIWVGLVMSYALLAARGMDLTGTI